MSWLTEACLLIVVLALGGGLAPLLLRRTERVQHLMIAFASGVFLGGDFIAVSKSDDQEWQHMKPAILGAIMEHFMSGTETIASDGANDAAGLNYDADDEETVQTIKELLDTRVRPAVAQDGGDITFHGFREGIVYLSMRGACAGCPSSTATLQGGIENLLRHFCPDVQEVRAV